MHPHYLDNALPQATANKLRKRQMGVDKLWNKFALPAWWQVCCVAHLQYGLISFVCIAPLKPDSQQLKTAAWQGYVQLKEHEASLNVELDSNHPEREFQICWWRWRERDPIQMCVDTHQVIYSNKFTTTCTLRFCWSDLSKVLEDVLFRPPLSCLIRACWGFVSGFLFKRSS